MPTLTISTIVYFSFTFNACTVIELPNTTPSYVKQAFLMRYNPVILLFAPPIVSFIQSHLSKKRYQLIEVSKIQPVEYELFLDYFLNENTAVLTSSDELFKVIKINQNEEQIYEIYKLIKDVEPSLDSQND